MESKHEKQKDALRASGDLAIEKIHSTFAAVATSLGYSEVHGRIIAALLVNQEPLSLQELSEKTG